jgi:hypothetical protein
MMRAQVGDRLTIMSNRIQQPVREAEILEVRGEEGHPPFVVRWEDTGSQTLIYPGSDARIGPRHDTSAATGD